MTFVYKRKRKPKGKSEREIPETHATLESRHRTDKKKSHHHTEM